jgi:hypothetical protein
MSALPPKADIVARQLDVRYVPIADIAARALVCAKLVTSPNLTGSPPVLKTIGIVEVAALAARAAVMPVATMTATLCCTKSAASSDNRQRRQVASVPFL